MSNIDGWLPKIAVATFSYYCLTFAFEIGYFWDVGVGYMPAFSVSEHAVHAASFIIATLGVVVIGYFATLIPALGINTEEHETQLCPPPKGQPIHWTKRLSFLLLLVPAVYIFTQEQLPTILRDGFRPTSLFGLLFMIAFLSYFAMLSFRVPRIYWTFSAILAAIISPVALGQVSFDNFVSDKEAVKVNVKISGRSSKVKVLFFGTDRMLVDLLGRPTIIGYPDDAVVLE